jgi:hypothetical protein
MTIDWEVVKPSLWTGVGGVVVGMFLLSYGFGFMSRNAAEKFASMSSEKAVITVLAPVCADKFAALPNVAARTATLVADKDNNPPASCRTRLRSPATEASSPFLPRSLLGYQDCDTWVRPCPARRQRDQVSHVGRRAQAL